MPSSVRDLEHFHFLQFGSREMGMFSTCRSPAEVMYMLRRLGYRIDVLYVYDSDSGLEYTYSRGVKDRNIVKKIVYEDTTELATCSNVSKFRIGKWNIAMKIIQYTKFELCKLAMAYMVEEHELPTPTIYARLVRDRKVTLFETYPHIYRKLIVLDLLVSKFPHLVEDAIVKALDTGRTVNLQYEMHVSAIEGLPDEDSCSIYIYLDKKQRDHVEIDVDRESGRVTARLVLDLPAASHTVIAETCAECGRECGLDHVLKTVRELVRQVV